MPALPSWLINPLWDQFAALLPTRPVFQPSHPLGCHRRRIPDRIVFDKLIQVLRFGCSYEGIADTSCSAGTIRNRRDEWIKLGIFARLKTIALDTYDRIVGLILGPDRRGRMHHQSSGRRGVRWSVSGRSRKQGMKRSLMVEGYGIPLGRVWPERTVTTRPC